MNASTFTLPEDCPLVALVMLLDRDLARGGSGVMPQQGDASWNALEPLPKRLLAVHSKLAAMGSSPLDEGAVHDLVRVAREFEAAVKQHRSGFGACGPLQADHNSPWSRKTFRAVVPALLAIEQAMCSLDGKPTAWPGVVEGLAGEIRAVGHTYPLQERHYRAVGELARRVLSVEARVGALKPSK